MKPSTADELAHRLEQLDLVPAAHMDAVWSELGGHNVPVQDFGAALVRHYAGVELMRRLIGVAQLPLPVDLAAKRALIDVSRTLVAS
jgi:5-methylthioribose kinase